MNTDVVGTLTQPYYALIFLLSGIISGALGFIVKSLFGYRKKLRIFISDVISTTIPCAVYILLSIRLLQGVFFVYCAFCLFLGYALSYFVLKKSLSKIKKLVLKKRNPK